MKRHIIIASILLAGVMAAIQIVGCTLVGLGLGAAIGEKPITLEGWELEKVEKRSRVEIRRTDGDLYDGYFQGVRLEPLDSYKSRYARWYARHTDRGWLPYLEDSIAVTDKSNLTLTGTFEGFDENVLYLGTGKGNSRVLDLTNIAYITGLQPGECDGEYLLTLSEEDGAPFRTMIALTDRYGKNIEYIDPNEIEQIKVKGKNYAVAGLVVGLAVDAVIVASLAVKAIKAPIDIASDAACEGDECSSCPFVYSDTGQEFALEGEVLGGAFFEAARRSDWIPMPQLQENDGLYRVRVANARDETDYIDEVKLIVFDHPRQSRAFASQNGRFYALTALRAPASAVDFDGSDVASLVSQPDREFWLGDPVHRNLGDPNDLRDGLVLEFPNVAAANDVVLAMRLKNAPWISSVEQALMELHGEALADWYDRLNESEEERARLMEMIVREALLQVEVWDGARWMPNGFVQGMSTLVWEDVAIPIDLEGIQTSTLKMRLSSTAGFWMIDSAQAGYDTNASVRFETLYPDRAAGQDGLEVRDDLLKEDGRSYAMPSNDYHVDVSFTAIPERPDFDRTYFLKVTGYYAPHLSPEGPPNLALLNDITTRPGALSEFALVQFQKSMREAVEDLHQSDH